MRPTLFSSNGNAFDANYDKVLSFLWTGNQSFKNRLRVYDNDTNELVYDNTQETFRLSHKLNAGSLQNGRCYYFVVTTFDENNNESEISNALMMYCFTTPVISVLIENDSVIKNSYYDVHFTYYQPENEQLNAYRLLLYNGLHELVKDTGIIYDTNELSVRITNLEDNNDYYVIVEGNTVNGIEFKSEEKHFYIEYKHADMFLVCGVENTNDGRIQIQSNVIAIEGKCTTEEIYHDGKIDLGSGYVYFDQDFNLSKDYSLILTGSDYQVNQMICTIGNSACIYFRKGAYESNNNEPMYYFELVVPSIISYRTQSQFVSSSDCKLLVQKHDNLYSIKVV